MDSKASSSLYARSPQEFLKEGLAKVLFSAVAIALYALFSWYSGNTSEFYFTGFLATIPVFAVVMLLAKRSKVEEIETAQFVIRLYGILVFLLGVNLISDATDSLKTHWSILYPILYFAYLNDFLTRDRIRLPLFVVLGFVGVPLLPLETATQATLVFILIFATAVAMDTIRLKDANAELNKNLARSSQTALAKQLEQQKHMFAVISHELRTPAASINMLLNHYADKTLEPTDQKQLLEISEHLVSVLDDLRYVAKPEHAEKSAELPTNLHSLIETTSHALSALLTERQQRLKFKIDPSLPDMLLVKSQVLRQILTNLLKNASIHSGASQIEVRVECSVKAGVAAIKVAVVDNGSGIDPQLQERLFTPFSRGATKSEGTGLGLYICKELAQQLGGELIYTPAVGGGSCFTFSFNAQVVVAEDATTAEVEDSAANIRCKRVLLAEDNLTIQLVTRKMLETAGAEVTAVENGAQALARYASAPDEFDAILTDIMMPEMDGYELTSQLRAQGYTKPIIGITAATIGGEREQLMERGADNVIAKPINLAALEAALGGALVSVK